MLACDTIQFGYTPRTMVLRDVSVRLNPGRMTALVGPNGSGKSTLLRLLAGLAKPGEGVVTLGGKPIHRWSPADRARRLSLIAQRPEVAFGYSVREVVGFGLVSIGRGTGSVSEAAMSALKRVGLADRARERFEHLSVGQQQRAALARALAQHDGTSSRVVLADEPVSAMDPKHAIESLTIIRELCTDASSQSAALVVLHDLNLALRFAHDAVLLDDQGRVAACGPTDEVLTQAVLSPVFGIGFERVSRVSGSPVLIPTIPEPADSV